MENYLHTSKDITKSSKKINKFAHNVRCWLNYYCMFRILILLISVTVLVFNVLNIEYDNLLDIGKNKSYLINSLVCILVIFYLIIYKDEK